MKIQTEMERISRRLEMYHRLSLFFIPLIIAGGRLCARIVMNLWNMIEPH